MNMKSLSRITASVTWLLACAAPSVVSASLFPRGAYIDPYTGLRHDTDATLQLRNSFYAQVDSCGMTHVFGEADSNSTANTFGLQYIGLDRGNLWYPPPPYDVGNLWSVMELEFYAKQEAENSDDPLRGYQFAWQTGQTITPDPTASGLAHRRCTPGQHPRGLALDAGSGHYPKNAYKSPRTWRIRFRMRVPDVSSSDTVCTIRVKFGGVLYNTRHLFPADFLVANQWRDIDVDVPNVSAWAMLDPEVEWHGHVRLDIDLVTVHNLYGNVEWMLTQLPVAVAEQEITDFFARINPSNHVSFPFHEFPPNKNALAAWWNARTQAVVSGHEGVQIWNSFLDVFLNEVPSPYFVPFAYPFTAHVDSATTGQPTSVQAALSSLTGQHGPQAEIARSFGRPRWFLIGVQSEWDCAADTIKIRDPQPNEIWVQAMLALAYGCRGLGYFLYASELCDVTAYITDTLLGVPLASNFMAASAGTDVAYRGLVDWSFQSRRFVPNYKYYVVQQLNTVLDSAWKALEPLTWVSAGGGDTVGQISGTIIDSLRSLTFSGNPHTEVGFFVGPDGSDCFMLVNRRCLSTETQQVRSWLHLTAGMKYVIDTYTSDTVLTGSLPSGAIPFMTTLEPGRAKLFKIVPVLTTYVSGSGLPKTWQGGIRVGGNVTVNSNRSLTILGPADIRVKPAAGYMITTYGSLTTSGTVTDSVFFRADTTAPRNDSWYGIKQLAPGNLSMQYTQVKHAYKGVWIADETQVNSSSIDRCDFRDNQVTGVWVQSDTASPISITNSHFTNLEYYGVNIYKGKATVQNNRFIGAFLNGVRLEGYTTRTTGGIIKDNVFDSMSTANAYGVYFQTVKDDTRRWQLNENLLEGNAFGPTWLSTYDQIAIGVNNCVDTIRLYKNRVRGEALYPNDRPTYGISNISTRLLLRGDLAAAESLSAVVNTRYGLHCLSSSGSDPDYAQVRACSFRGSNYNVWVFSNSKVDMGTSSDSGYNVLVGKCCPSGQQCGFSYTVYNNNSSYIVPAVGNFWASSSGEEGGGEGIPCAPGWPHTGGVGTVNALQKLVANPFASPMAKLVVDVDQPAPPPVESGQLLANSYPNPLNSSMVIQVTLSTPSETDVAIYNILGQRIRRLADERFEAGEHRLAWDGTDDYGRAVSSGVYFYRVQTPSRQITRQVVVLK